MDRMSDDNGPLSMPTGPPSTVPAVDLRYTGMTTTEAIEGARQAAEVLRAFGHEAPRGRLDLTPDRPEWRP